MKFGLLSLAACAGLAALPALAQSTPESVDFTVKSGREGCWVASAPGNPSGIAVEAGFARDGRIWLRASGKDWPFAARTNYPIRIRAVSPTGDAPYGDEYPVVARGYRDSAGWGGIAIAPQRLTDFSFALYRGDGAEPFALIADPVWNYNIDLRSCLNGLARGDRGSGKPAATAPLLRGQIGDYIEQVDYPVAAWRAEKSGDTRVRLTISAHGIPSACAVTRPSGTAVLDATSCTLLLRRASFTPALDRSGRATEGVFDITLHWVLPPGRPPITYGIR